MWTDRPERPWDVLAHDLIVHERPYLVREVVATTLVIAVLFSLGTMLLSWNGFFDRADLATSQTQGAVTLYDNGTYVFSPAASYVWNESQVVVDRVMLSRMTFLRSAVAVIMEVGIVGFLAGEVLKTRSYIRRELRPAHWVMSAAWAFGARRRWILDMYLSGKTLALACSYFLGVVLAQLALLPFIHAQVGETVSNVFFSAPPTPIAYGVSALLPIAAWTMYASTLVRMLRKDALLRASREFQ